MTVPPTVWPIAMRDHGDDESTLTELTHMPDPESGDTVRLHLGRDPERSYVAASSDVEGSLVELGSSSRAVLGMSDALRDAGHMMRAIEEATMRGRFAS